ncbi:phage baseplate assembly protein V [Duganella sp. SG902]|uniref:phage baseplate assembly protein V n=1 Tax=Duganella sp. SG902 TaxID=2587016 RepID=UPI00159D9134
MDMNESLRLLLNLVRKGTVLAVDYDKALCRVATGELETNWLPWLTLAAGKTLTWEPPEEGEQILLVCPGGDPAEGVVLRGLYADDNAPPSNKPTTHTRLFPDGARIEYDHDSHELVVDLPDGATVLLSSPGSVTIKTATATIEADSATVKADTITLDASSTHCTGDLTVDGDVDAKNVNAATEVKAGNITLTGHGHMEMGDGKRVGPPLP